MLLFLDSFISCRSTLSFLLAFVICLFALDFTNTALLQQGAWRPKAKKGVGLQFGVLEPFDFFFPRPQQILLVVYGCRVSVRNGRW